MRFTDETLMAFADGELEEPARSEVEQAIRKDPVVAAKVAQHRALRADVFSAFAGALEEPVPPRLRQVVANSNVIHLDSVRALRQDKEPEPAPRQWSWPEWGAIAATLVLGVLAGSFGWQRLQPEQQLAALDRGVVAEGKLAHALSTQLASSAGTGVRIGVSFVSVEGNYCRSFSTGATAGLACRDGGDWKIALMAEVPAAAGGDYRQAAVSMPQALLDAIDQRIKGKALDAKGEQAAAASGWTR
ncbi:MAG: hypothetical protein JF619_29305 [Massilia sp.]|nr:hypothetical protein [Massilia sp.]